MSALAQTQTLTPIRTVSTHGRTRMTAPHSSVILNGVTDSYSRTRGGVVRPSVAGVGEKSFGFASG
jgi:hypothetical protein